MQMRERDETISLIRGFAMCMIIACHICQYYEWTLAWWLNVGVQIFLILSGYLYANRKITDRLSFYWKRLCKILVEYWLFLLPTTMLFWSFVPQIMSPVRILELFAAHGTVEGLGHLWYIPYILLCYGLTPLFQDFFEHMDKREGYKYFIYLVGVLMMIHLLFKLFVPFFNPAWINTYILGMSLGRLSNRQKSRFNEYGVLYIILTGILFGAHIGIKVCLGIETEDLWKMIEPSWRDYEHVLLGISLFISMRAVLSRVCVRGGVFLHRLCRFIDLYSYDIYLTHHPFILGPFSLMALTKFRVCNMIIILCLTLICAVILHKIAFPIQKKLLQI